MRRTIGGLALAIAALMSPVLAEAGLDFGDSSALAPGRAAADGSARDIGTAVASDGAGVWVVTWASEDPAAGIPVGDEGVVVSRSVDDGSSWSLPTQVIPPLGPLGITHLPRIATDGNGIWVISASTEFSVITVSSLDNGANWGPVVEVIDEAATNEGFLDIATDGSGAWVLVWESDDPLGGTIGDDYDILFSRSIDNGQTWSAPAAVDPAAATDVLGDDDYIGGIQVDSAGNWLVVWQSAYEEVLVARSIDAGQTWSLPVVAGSTFLGAFGFLQPAIAADEEGNWTMTWDAQLGVELNSPEVIWTARSTDAGANWSAQQVLHPYLEATATGSSHSDPSSFVLAGGVWGVAWNSYDDTLRGALGRGRHSMVSYSRNGGQTWSSPASLTTRSRVNREDVIEFTPDFASSPTGQIVAVQASEDSLGDTIGTDLDILVATARRDCPLTARMDCKSSTVVDGSRLTIKDKEGGRDRLNWRLKRAQATVEADLGDPVTSDDYVLCLYEKVNATPGLVGEWDARAGGTCKDSPCWTQSPGRVALKDRRLERGSMRTLEVVSGASGEASVSVSVSGPALAPPRLPLDATAPVHVQLINVGTNGCWEGVHDQAKTNDAARFDSTSN